jgi:hypothetical protein
MTPDWTLPAKRGSASAGLLKDALLRARLSRTATTRIFALAALVATMAFYRAVIVPTICDIAGRPASCASPEKTMDSSASSQIVPHQLQVQLFVVPQGEQRYDTSGDWLWSGNRLEIRVSREMADQDPRYAMLLFVHEMIEALLCRSSGISAAEVDSFDMSHPQADEPGADPAAPYHRQHMAAEAVERALAEKLGVKWEDYISE